jgi:hypothetical protein
MFDQKPSAPNLKVFTAGRENIYKFNLSKTMRLGVGILILMLLLTFSILIAASYTSFDLPLVSKGVQRKVDYLVASVPLVPKTPKQILTKAFEDSRNIKTAKETFSLLLQSGEEELVSVTIEAKLDTNDLDNVALEAQIEGKISQGSQEATVDIDLVEKGSNLFFKIDKIPTFPGYDLGSLSGKWYSIDLEKAGEEIGAQVLEDASIKSDVEEKIEEIFDTLDETNIFEKIKKLPDEEVVGRDSYHLFYLAETSDLVKIFQKLLPEASIDKNEIEKVLGDTKIDLWVDKKTYFINQVETSFKLIEIADGATLQVVPISQQLEVKASYTLSDINEPIKIEAPKNAQNLSSFIELLMMIQPTSSNLLLQEAILGVSTQTIEFGSNAFFYERLLRVLTLFPNTI